MTFGVGVGVCALSIKNFDIIKREDNKNVTIEKVTVPVQQDLVIMSNDLREYNFVVDDSIPADSIQLEAAYDHDIKDLKNRQDEEDKLNVYKVYGEFKSDYKKNYKLFIKDLKNNKINVDHLDSGINSLTIKANSENINKLISNLEKLYLLEKHADENTTKVIRHRDKVMILNGKYVEYDARTDELIYTEIAPKDYKCSRTVRKDTWGEFIEYQCVSPDDYIDYEDLEDEFEEDYDE